jgi:hypothetical protein
VAEKPAGRGRIGPLETFRALGRHPAASALFTVVPGVSATIDILQQGRTVPGPYLLFVVPMMLGAVLGAVGYTLRDRPIAIRFSGLGVTLTVIGFANGLLLVVLTELTFKGS